MLTMPAFMIDKKPPPLTTNNKTHLYWNLPVDVVELMTGSDSGFTFVLRFPISCLFPNGPRSHDLGVINALQGAG